MKEKKTKNYEPPHIEVVEVEVEKGFAASNPIDGTTVNEGMGGTGGGNFPDW